MKLVLWLLALFAAAVAAMLAARYNNGYVLLVAQPYRIELSLNLLVVLLVMGFVLAYILVRLVSVTLNIPTEVREFRLRRRREKAHTVMLDGLKAFFEGRYAKAEKAASAALKLQESPVASAINAIVASRSAHELRNFSRRDELLAAAEKDAPDETVLRIVTQAELLLDERRYQEALKVLQALRAKGERQHTSALRLELKARQGIKNWDAVLDLVGQLAQRDAFDKTLVEQLRRNARLENLKSNSLNPQALKECWHAIPAAEKKDSKLAAAAARAFMVLGGCESAHQIIEQSLQSSQGMDEQWDSELVGLYGECLGGDAIRQIERAEAWLKSRPNDAALLLALGKLCAHCELWGKAQNYLEASLSVEPGHPAYLALAQLNEKIGKPELAKDQYCKGLELALKRLG